MKPNTKKSYTARPLGQTVYRPYDLPAGEGPLAVQDYLIKDMRGGRFCFLRFAKKIPYAVEQIDLELIELDALGKELGRKPVVLPQKHLPDTVEGELLVPRCGIRVDDRCAAVQVILRQIASAPYLYRMENDCAVAEYVLEEKWQHRQRKKNEPSFRVSAKGSGSLAVPRLLAAAALVILLSVLLAPYIKEFLAAIT